MNIKEAFKWEDQAACATEDTEVFFFGDAESNQKAVEICDGCPVKTECLKANLGEPYGIFGGTTPGERIEMGGGCKEPTVLRFDDSGRVVDEGRPDPEIVQSRAERRHAKENRAETQKSVLQTAAIYYQSDESLSIKAVARRFGMSHTTLGPYLRKMGVTREPHRKTAVRKMMESRGYGDETTMLIVKHLKNGEKPMEISRKLGVDKYKVYNLRISIEKGVY